MFLLQREEPGFSVKASGVAGEAAVPAYDAVAGDDEGDGISSDGASDCLRGHLGKAALFGEALCDGAVGRGRSVGDLKEDVPDGELECAAHWVKRRQEVRLASGNVKIQPAPAFHQRGSFLCLCLCGESGGIVSLSLEPKAGESRLISSEEDVAEWGVVVLYECHYIPRNVGELTGCIASSLYRKREENAIRGILSSCGAPCPFHVLKNFLFTNIHAKCILVTSLILNKDKERKRVNRFSGRELPHGERQQRVLTKSSASPVSE